MRSHTQYETDRGGSQPLQIQIYHPVEKFNNTEKILLLPYTQKRNSEDDV